MTVKYEIENFKDKPVTLDMQENMRHIRNEVRGDTGRDVAMGAGQGDDLRRGPDSEKSTFEQAPFPRQAARPRRRREG